MKKFFAAIAFIALIALLTWLVIELVQAFQFNCDKDQFSYGSNAVDCKIDKSDKLAKAALFCFGCALLARINRVIRQSIANDEQKA